jgi:hypothetical protein
MVDATGSAENRNRYHGDHEALVAQVTDLLATATASEREDFDRIERDITDLVLASREIRAQLELEHCRRVRFLQRLERRAAKGTGGDNGHDAAIHPRADEPSVSLPA